MNDIIQIVLSITEATEMISDSFLCVFLERINKDGTLAQQSKILQWAHDNKTVISAQGITMFLNFSLKCQLNYPIKRKEDKKFVQQIQQTWLHEELENTESQLPIAYTAWQALCNDNLEQAQTIIKPFFQNWEDNLEKNIDIDALTILCAINFMVKKPSFIYEMPKKAVSNTHEKLIRAAFNIIARQGTQKPFVIPNINISISKMRNLCLLYIGQKIGETNHTYSQRLKKDQLPNLSDLRKTKNATTFSKPEPEKKDWVISSFMNTTLPKQVREIIANEIDVCSAIATKNGDIDLEEPQYGLKKTETEFIKWVEKDKNIVTDFIKNPSAVKSKFANTFPKFPKHAKDTFFKELEEKAEHQKDFETLKHDTKIPQNKKEPFWYLVEQTAQLIDIIQNSTRSENKYDIYVTSKEHALLVVLLIQEWNNLECENTLDANEIADCFHGPEIHVWGKGPRIPHFNAGVYIAGQEKLKNVHIFF